MFLTLGLLATPSTFLAILLPAVALGLFLVLVARPVAVWLCLLPFGFTGNETAFVAGSASAAPSRSCSRSCH